MPSVEIRAKTNSELQHLNELGCAATNTISSGEMLLAATLTSAVVMLGEIAAVLADIREHGVGEIQQETIRTISAKEFTAGYFASQSGRSLYFECPKCGLKALGFPEIKLCPTCDVYPNVSAE
jgi:hypothetical protein